MATMKNTKEIKRSTNPLKKGGFLYNNRYLFLSFIITFAIMFLAYALQNIAPFHAIIPDFLKPTLEKLGLFQAGDAAGDRMSLVIDQYHQYFPFFKELHEKVTTGGSLLYSWEGGLGTNFIALIAYYATSPIYLLSLLVPVEKLTQFMTFAVILKLSFASSAMFVYLRSMTKKENFVTVLFSVCYGLSAYAIGYSWCIMWLDVFALLPLCLLGLNKIIDEGKFSLYVITLGLIMFTNYYIGVMVCMFIVLYYPVLYFSRTEKRGAKKCLFTTFKVIGYSALGCFLASIVLIPTYLSMQNVYYMGKSFSQNSKAYSTLLETLGNLLPGGEVTVRGGLPNIYVGLFAVIMAVLFFINKKISVKKKVGYGILLTFLLVSFNWNVLDFIWHGLHFPNELPFRYSFVFSFLIIDMAYSAFVNMDEISSKQIGAVAAGSFATVLLFEILLDEQLGYLAVYGCLALLAIYFLLLALYKSNKIKSTICFLLIAIMGIGETTVFAINGIDRVGATKHSTYFENYDEIQNLIDYVEETDKDFYRIETSRPNITNDPALYGYKGVSLFTSSFNSKLGKFLHSLGAASPQGANRLSYYLSTPILNSIYNLKYLMSRGVTMQNDSSFELVNSFGNSNLYKNKYPLSLGYMVNKNVLKYDSKRVSDCFKNQETFIKMTTGKEFEFFRDINNPVITISNGTFTKTTDDKISVKNTKENTIIYYEYEVSEAQDLYMFVGGNYIDCIYARVGNDFFRKNLFTAKNSIVGIGHAEAGDTVNIKIELKHGKDSDIGVKLKGFNTEEWEKAYKLLSDEMLQVTEYSDTKVKGTITAKTENLMMTSIPYEKGWSVKVDGQKAEVIPVCNAFCGINLSAGTHEIEFSYFPAGLTTGIILTVLSIAILITLIILKKRRDSVMLLKETQLIEGETENPEPHIPTPISEKETSEEEKNQVESIPTEEIKDNSFENPTEANPETDIAPAEAEDDDLKN